MIGDRAGTGANPLISPQGRNSRGTPRAQLFQSKLIIHKMKNKVEGTVGGIIINVSSIHILRSKPALYKKAPS